VPYDKRNAIFTCNTIMCASLEFVFLYSSLGATCNIDKITFLENDGNMYSIDPL
jgi:hypothetical protein